MAALWRGKSRQSPGYLYSSDRHLTTTPGRPARRSEYGHTYIALALLRHGSHEVAITAPELFGEKPHPTGVWPRPASRSDWRVITREYPRQRSGRSGGQRGGRRLALLEAFK